jgi:ketosteroid isomerase-like protein
MFSRILFLIVASTFALSQSAPTAKSSSADQIRSMRQEVDKAFQRHDPKQLATLVSPDCHFTAPSIHIDGSDALERFHGSLFLKRPDVILTHHANRIVVNEHWDVASEQGQWLEHWTDKDGVTELRGTYLAMWKRSNSHWLEYSEIIVPETCTGSSYCR